MARKVAMMEYLGPDPVKAFARLEEAVGGDEIAQWYFKQLSGELSRPETQWISGIGQGLRSAVSATMLGKLPVSMISDIGYSTVTAIQAGMKADQVVSHIFKQVATLGQYLGKGGNKDLAAQMLLETNHIIESAQLLHRFGDLSGPSTSIAWLANLTMKATGAENMDIAARVNFGLSMSRVLAEGIEGKLGRKFNTLMERYNISTDDMAKVKGAIENQDGIRRLNPSKIDDPFLQEKFIGIVQAEMESAVPTASVRTQAATAMGQARGTAAGELTRTFGTFKSFAANVVFNHLTRGWKARNYNNKWAGRAEYFGMMAATLVPLGVLSVVLSDMLDGKKPVNPLTAKGEHSWDLIKRGIRKSGTGGIFLDFLSLDYNSPFSGSPSLEFLAGPGVTLVADSWDDIWSTMQYTKDGELGKAYKKASKTGIKLGGMALTPSNFWYSKLLFDRLVEDQFKDMADPNYRRNVQRSSRRLRKDTGQEYWWDKGESRPEFLQ